MDKKILMFVNDKEHTVVTDPQRILLEVLREDLKLTGTNFGCKEGLCGACTVLIDDEPNHSCMVKVGDVENKWITTIDLPMVISCTLFNRRSLTKEPSSAAIARPV